MADYGGKISKEGYDTTVALTEANKKNFTLLSSESAHKVKVQGVVATDTNIAHGLAWVPLCDVYAIDASGTQAYRRDYEVDDTYLYLTASAGLPTFYIINYNEN